jgi:leucyl/phenylalanyl-tRNA---protein transferase
MMYLLSDDALFFPPTHKADTDTGILALGGDLSSKRLLLAYSLGIFPWYDEKETPILWHAPNTRMVLFPDQLIVNRSLRRRLNKNSYELKYDTAFDQVLQHCADVKRDEQNGTWLNADLRKGLSQLHSQGYAHSAEAWLDGELVGGLYGVTLGGIFFGESMFALKPDASKVVFVHLVKALHNAGYQMIDCQAYTDHLSRFGAYEISRTLFSELLIEALSIRPSIPWPNHR